MPPRRLLPFQITVIFLSSSWGHVDEGICTPFYTLFDVCDFFDVWDVFDVYLTCGTFHKLNPHNLKRSYTIALDNLKMFFHSYLIYIVAQCDISTRNLISFFKWTVSDIFLKPGFIFYIRRFLFFNFQVIQCFFERIGSTHWWNINEMILGCQVYSCQSGSFCSSLNETKLN